MSQWKQVEQSSILPLLLTLSSVLCTGSGTRGLCGSICEAAEDVGQVWRQSSPPVLAPPAPFCPLLPLAKFTLLCTGIIPWVIPGSPKAAFGLYCWPSLFIQLVFLPCLIQSQCPVLVPALAVSASFIFAGHGDGSDPLKARGELLLVLGFRAVFLAVL